MAKASAVKHHADLEPRSSMAPEGLRRGLSKVIYCNGLSAEKENLDRALVSLVAIERLPAARLLVIARLVSTGRKNL